MAEPNLTSVVAERFAGDVTDHLMTVELEQGPYLHLRFRAPGTGMYWFDLIAWPGTLTIRGDMGTFVFARCIDMVGFFRGQRVNPQYWAEKEQSGAPTKAYDEDKAKRLVDEHLAELADAGYDAEDIGQIKAAAAEQLVADEDFVHELGAHTLLQEFLVELKFSTRPFMFHDTWEWDLKEWTYQYLWSCHAIAWGIRQYDVAKARATEHVGVVTT